MAAKILDGKEVATKLKKSIKNDVSELKTVYGIEPSLAVIIVGLNPASEVYVGRKYKACQEIGIRSEVIRLPESTSEAELSDTIVLLNNNPKINGILVQLPLPKHIDTKAILDKIAPDKDVDGFHPINVGKLRIGIDGLVPCTPYGVIKMLEISNIPIEGRHAVIIGASDIVGKPMASLLLARNATITVCHDKTVNLTDVTRQADILIVAIGQPKFIGTSYIKPGATVIDVGINRVDGKLYGDVDFEVVKEIAGAITPVPGGVGPLTITMLLYNTVKATKMQTSLELNTAV